MNYKLTMCRSFSEMGVRLFDHLDVKNSQLEKDRVLDSPHATHIRYRVVKEK